VTRQRPRFQLVGVIDGVGRTVRHEPEPRILVLRRAEGQRCFTRLERSLTQS
jgi:hypothetical protein